MIWPANTTLIGRLRVQGRASDPLLTRLRVAQVLDHMEVHPHSLPPAAILCVRHLRDPRPHALDLHASRSVAAGGWEQALAVGLDQLGMRATRPLRGSVPSTAEAVVFT